MQNERVILQDPQETKFVQRVLRKWAVTVRFGVSTLRGRRPRLVYLLRTQFVCKKKKNFEEIT